MNDIEYQVCTRCVMDTTDPDITFDDQGVCNHCRSFDQIAGTDWLPGQAGKPHLDALLAEIKAWGKGREYDCTIGLSGGADSSYLAYLAAKEWGLRPLAVHVDTGWNSPFAVRNIENLVKKLNIDLYTFVIDWEEMRDLQVAFLKSGVANQDTPQDHAIFAKLFSFTAENKIRYVLSGHNIATESVLPESWEYTARDDKHIRAIHRRFGTRPLKTLPIMSVFRSFLYARLAPIKFLPGMKIVNPLDFVDYTKDQAKENLSKEVGWQEYGAKHFESRFTKFFQAYWLPKRFGYDKRRAHLSSLVLSGQISRDHALAELDKPMYPLEELAEDMEFVRKKLELSESEFEEILSAPTRHHSEYPSYAPLGRIWRRVQKSLQALRRSLTPKARALAPLGKLNICILGSASDTHVVTRARAIARQGHMVTMISRVPGSTNEIPILVPKGFNTPFNVVNKALIVFPLAWMIWRQRADVFYAHYAAEYECWLAALLRRRPFAINAMGSDILIEATGRRGPLRAWLTRFALKTAKAVTVKSPYLAQTVLDLGIDPGRVSEVIWGIDPKNYHRDMDKRREWRARWGVDEDTLVILSPRPFEKLYRQHLAIQALPKVLEKHPNAILALSEFKQDLSYRRELETLARNLGISAHVVYVAPQTEEHMPGLLSAADVIVSLAYTDGTPQTVLEAQACDTPVLIADIPDIRHVFTDRKNCLFSTDDPKSIADGLDLIASDETLRNSIIAGGRQLVSEKANLPRELERVEAILRDVVSG
ncbi:N-acetyl sugar amidotransferase [bacterium SCSIO 12827]|nr:N-acetyl sugar amidotransferase [bacterium SCSIO 12827]